MDHKADPHVDRILILDFGSQYTQLIARRVREVGVYCEIQPHSIEVDRVRDLAPLGIILSGGPETVTNSSTPRVDPALYRLELPLLGICYGMQVMVHQLGGKVAPSSKKEYGHAILTQKQYDLALEELN